MATERRSPQGQPPDRRDAGEPPVRIFSCSRLGMQANPPRPVLGAWLWRR